MKHLYSVTVGVLALSLLSVGAAQAQEAEVTLDVDPAAEPPRCVRLMNINGYSVVDDEHLVLNGGVSRHYLVTLRQRCLGLRFGTQIATTFARNERVCRPFIEYVHDGDGLRCAVDQVEEVESLEAARALIAARAELEAEAALNEARD